MFTTDSIDKNVKNKVEKKINHAVTEIRRLNGFMKS